MSGNRSLSAILAEASASLAPVSSTPRLDAELLAGHALGLSRVQVLTRGDEVVPDATANAILQFVKRRRLAEPLAYILGRKEFWSLMFEVNEHVLVPRPETELLVELALAAGDVLNRAVHVLDLGTGSGAIAIAIASERPAWRVTAIDRSGHALEVARRNAAHHGLARVELLEGDWFAPVSQRKFDVIVSNPPYLAADDPALRDATLAFEPLDALTDHADGLRHFRHIADTALAHLSAHGALIFEHAPAQADALRAELVARGYGHVRSHRDVAGHERATEARSPQHEG